MTDINLLPPDVHFKDRSGLKKIKLASRAWPVPPVTVKAPLSAVKAAGAAPKKNGVNKTAPGASIKPVLKPEDDDSIAARARRIMASLRSNNPQTKTEPVPAVSKEHVAPKEHVALKEPKPKKESEPIEQPAHPSGRLGLEVNLIQSQESPYASPTFVKNLWRLIFFVVLEGILITGLYVYYGEHYLAPRKIESEQLIVQIDALKKSISAYSDETKSLVLFQRKLQAFSGLLKEHVLWTRFFKFLEKSTLPEVYYSNAAIDGTHIVLKTHAPDLPTAVKQLLVFKGAKEIKKVSIAQLNRDEGATVKNRRAVVGFSFDLELSPDLVRNHEQ